MAKNTIVGRGFLNIRDQIVSTAAAITPGHLVERTSAGLVQKHSTAGGAADKLFALEDAHQGKGITDAYANSTPIQVWKAIPGERVYAIHDATTGGSLDIGEFVESAGDGTVRGYTKAASAGVVEYSDTIIGVALETAVPGARVLIEIM